MAQGGSKPPCPKRPYIATAPGSLTVSRGCFCVYEAVFHQCVTKNVTTIKKRTSVLNEKTFFLYGAGNGNRTTKND
nr:MAG TPA: hypothetical protein [Caudoviricetes sp.]